MGYALAALFVCAESWMLAASDEKAKGRVLAFYLLSYYVAQAFSQLLLGIPFSEPLMVFCLVGAVIALSTLPVCLTRFAAPVPEKLKLISPMVLIKKAPLGLWAGLSGGMILGVVYTMFPFVLAQDGFDKGDVAVVMFSIILGGGLLQMPIGRWSDRTDRRRVIFAACIATFGLGILAALIHSSFIALTLVSFFLGGVTFTIYPLAISHTADYVGREFAVTAIALITVIYGVGSMIGPLILPFFLHWHVMGFYLYLALIGLLLGLYTLWRILHREPATDTVNFIPLRPEMKLSQEKIREV